MGHNYALTRIGIEPARSVLSMALKNALPPDVTDETPGFKELCSILPETGEAFVDMLEKDFGGAEGYCKEILGFSDQEIEKVKEHLRN